MASCSSAASAIHQSAPVATPSEFLAKIAEWDHEKSITDKYYQGESFLDTNKGTITCQPPSSNLRRIAKMDHTHPNNLIIGVGGVINLGLGYLVFKL